MLRFLFAGALPFISIAASLAGDTWPCWRGPTGQGITDEKNLPLQWNGKTGENILWKAPLPGSDGVRFDLNQSSPIVWKDRVFVTIAFWPKGVDKNEYPEHRVACYAVANGEKLWDVPIPPGPWKLKDLRGGYTAPTPATDGERVYVLFGSSVLVSLDFQGKIVWRKEIAPFFWDVCIGTSPVLVNDLVLVLADGTKTEQSRLIAYDKKTGDVKWEKPRPKASFSHSTPLVIDVKGERQLIVASSSELQGVDPASGKVIWWVKNKGDVPTPAFGKGLVYSEDGRGGPAVAIEPGGEGDLTSKVKWKTKPIPEGYSSPTIAGEFVYRMHNPGVLKCIRLSNGETAYSERMPSGVEQAASPILTPENNLIFASGGKSVVVPVGPAFETTAMNELNDGSPASPAVAAGRIFIKGARNLYCISKK